MSIVATEVESIHGALGQQRAIWYRCLDDLGDWHKYGPVMTIDDGFDVDAHKTAVASKVEDELAESEFVELVGE